MIHVADLSDLDYVISDRDLAQEHRQMLEEHGIEFMAV
jgi:DeoR/GlpR family transcriptional regulator of sugar metabolism